MSDHLRLVSDNTKGAVVPGPGFNAQAVAPRDYVQSFVFLEDNGVMVIMHNGKEVSALAAVDAMVRVAAELNRRALAARAGAPSAQRPEPTIYDDLMRDVRRAQRPGEVCAEIYGDGA